MDNKTFELEFKRLFNMVGTRKSAVWYTAQIFADKLLMHRLLLHLEMNKDKFDKMIDRMSDSLAFVDKNLGTFVAELYLDQFKDIEEWPIVEFFERREVEDKFIDLLDFSIVKE